MLGLGSKSALTYTNSFVITAVKDGRIAKAIVSFNDEGVPVFHVVHEGDTDEPTGVEINIPVRDKNTFAKKTAEFVKYWPDGIVEIDGAEPLKHGYEKVADTTLDSHYDHLAGKQIIDSVAEVFLAPGGGTGYYATQPRSYVVMGNVAYIVEEEHVPEDLNALRVGFVAYVPIGSVTIVPSREKLYYSSKTKDVIAKVATGLADTIIDKKQAEIDNAGSHQAAWMIISQLSYEMRNTTRFRNGVTYKGDAFVTDVPVAYRNLSKNWNDKTDETSYGRLHLNNVMTDPLPLFVINSEYEKDKKISTTMRRKAFYYAGANGHADRSVFFVEGTVDNVWVKHVPTVEWKALMDLKIPRTPNANPRPTEVPYDVFFWVPPVIDKKTGKVTQRGYVGSDSTTSFDPKKRLFYISPADMAEQRHRRGTSPSHLLGEFKDETIQLAVMGTNRFEKFLRLHPKAKPFKDYAQERIDKMVANVSDVHLIVDNFSSMQESFVKVADMSKIDDPEVVAFIQSYHKGYNASDMDDILSLTRYLVRANIYVTVPESTTTADPFEKYPLVGMVGDEYVEHTYTYINAQFAK